jgi:hypothetical protein
VPAITLETTHPKSSQRSTKMFKTLKRIGLILATSSGIVTATTLTAHAGLGINHCEPKLAEPR